MKTPPFWSEIFEPVEVLKAPHYADRAMMKTREGEIRLYGARLFEHENGVKHAFPVVLKSNDGGWSFREEAVSADHAGATVCSPYSGDYLTILTLPLNDTGSVCRESEMRAPRQLLPHEKGTFALRSSGGPDGSWEETKISSEWTLYQRLPLPLKHRKRWINIGQRWVDGIIRPIVILSDDDGHTWRETILPYPPMFELHYPHKGMRWFMPGVEPAFAETPSGQILMLLRTSVDVHYQCYSDDGGETWSEMVPSPFFSVATMPGLYTLSSGRMIAVWNNSTPLAELDHTEQGLDEAVIKGNWEDVFTNRDVLHAAYSDDEGQSWHGFRELVLNPVRNNGDFRTTGGVWELRDKSVHQNQLLELPGGKVLLHYGQQNSCSRVIIFDPAFLEVKERKGDFMTGLRDWSTQLYYKSISGGLRIAGHCAWNRRGGAQLMPSPQNDWCEALLIGRHPDDRLFSDREGAVWNFPAARQGIVTADLTFMPGSQGIRISLCDRWINPCDEYVKELAVFTLGIDGEGWAEGIKLAEPGKRVQLAMRFDLDRKELEISSTYGKLLIPVTQTLSAPFGNPVELSYLHLQSLAETEDLSGVYLHETFMKIK